MPIYREGARGGLEPVMLDADTARGSGGKREVTASSEMKKPDLSITDIRGAADELRKKVIAARQHKEKDIERKVSEHDQLRTEILSMRQLLETAQSTRDYFTAVQQAGELPAGSEVQLSEIEATVTGLEAQIAEAERRINVFGAQPEILDRIHEAASSMRDGEIKEATMKEGIESLTKGNDALAAEVNALAQELRETVEEHGRVTEEFQMADKGIRELIKKAGVGLVYDKHGPTMKLLDYGSDTPTVEQLEQRRGQLGWTKGKEKAAVDIVLQHSDELKRYHELRASQQVLQDKIWKELRTKRREALKTRIIQHMIKAWELHEQTGIEAKSYEQNAIHAPETVFKDLETKVKALGGVKLVERRGKRPGDVPQMIEEVPNDTPQKTAIRDLWSGMKEHGQEDGIWLTSYSKPKIKSAK